MSRSRLAIPEAVRNKAIVAGVESWLIDLPEILDELAQQWGLTLGEAFTDSTEAYVCRSTGPDGAPTVLKVIVPRDVALYERELAVLRLAGGSGCAELLAAAHGHHAMLLERLGPSLHELDLPIAQRHEILVETAQRLWRQAPGLDALNVMTGHDKAIWLAAAIERWWNELDRPVSERVVEQALGCAERRRDAHDRERAVLVHGDVHEWNVLQTFDGADYKLVDPDGLLAEPEYDLGIIMREDPVELMHGHPDDRAHWLAARSGCDWVAIREWGIVERVSTGLLCTQIDLQPVGRQMLEAAEYVAASSS